MEHGQRVCVYLLPGFCVSVCVHEIHYQNTRVPICICSVCVCVCVTIQKDYLTSWEKNNVLSAEVLNMTNLI